MLNNSTLFITGAGISQTAGIPTFEELYEDQSLLYSLSENCFMERPDLTWEATIRLIMAVEGVIEPTIAHRTIANYAVANEVQVITQNVDRLHEQAGSQNVRHLHGTADCAYCVQCRIRYQINPRALTEPPQCATPTCNDRILHPGFVLFGGYADELALVSLRNAASKLPPKRLFLIGTNASMPYIQHLVQQVSLMNLTDIIEINPKTTAVSKHARMIFNEPADEVLPDLLLI